MSEPTFCLDNILYQLYAEPRVDGAEITSGGNSVGFHLEIEVRDGQTPERYRLELMRWMDERRAKRRTA